MVDRRSPHHWVRLAIPVFDVVFPDIGGTQLHRQASCRMGGQQGRMTIKRNMSNKGKGKGQGAEFLGPHFGANKEKGKRA